MIINYYKQKGFFLGVFCSQSRYLSRKCPNFLATCVWNPGVTWSSLPSCSWSATMRLLYKKLYEAHFISDIDIKKQNKKQIPLYLPTEIKDLQPFAKVSSL